jgi:dTMP kinase
VGLVTPGDTPVLGLLIAFEGLDQSGKQTQAELLRDRLTAAGRQVHLLSFPDYTTAIGEEIERALRSTRDYGPDVMQLLYVANRYEWKARIVEERARGTILVCDRYLASSVAYGEAHGLDPQWLLEMQRFLPQPDITFLLDIAPEVSARRKTADRDKYERDLALLARVRNSYLRQAASGWVRLDADRDRDVVAADVHSAVMSRLVSS